MQASQLQMKKAFFGLWDFWNIEESIARLLSIPKLEKDGYVIDYNTNRDWVVATPECKTPPPRKMLVCARKYHTWMFVVTMTPL